MPDKSPVFRPKRQHKARQEYKKKVRKRYDKQRGTAHQRGYCARWRKERKLFLSENPLCVHCLQNGLSVLANEVDHIKPHRGDYDLFWDRDNWQSLCKPCHSRKTATEDSDFARQRILI